VVLSKTHELKKLLRKARLKTVCEESRCPNISECFSNNTATFMILGNRCTRRCAFCNVNKGSPLAPDPKEPYRLLWAVRALNLKYVVITSVTRDDLPDYGAGHFAECIKVLKENIPGVRVEVLIPDFRGDKKALETVLKEEPSVLNHNVETVKRLYPVVRKGANYERSLRVLKLSKEIAPHITTKSALILGFGETKEEIIKTMEDIRKTGCDILVVGQYYQPSLSHHPVVKYYSEEEFKEIEEIAYEMGFKFVVSAQNARSSYRALESFSRT
ncbi:MAG: lipoyl synthase, partial [Aquificae bacterium]|nr:lipoyl synthase [Aquificota bacterium]